jgi:hypothetical protein
VRLTSLIYFLLFFVSFKVNAQGHPKQYSQPLYAEAVVDVPLFVAAGGGYSFNEHLQTDLVYGVMPGAFSSLIGQVAASSAGNDNYQNLVEDALEDNSMFRLAGTYNLDNRNSGWHFSIAGILLNSSGDADANEISRAFGGRDYSTLLTLLIASGRNTNVHMDTTLQIFEGQVSYSWKIKEYLILDFSGGLLKVINSDVSLHTGLSNYENTQQGRDLIKASENDIESMIEQYGLSPSGGVALKYYF